MKQKWKVGKVVFKSVNHFGKCSSPKRISSRIVKTSSKVENSRDKQLKTYRNRVNWLLIINNEALIMFKPRINKERNEWMNEKQ
jgi:hypothetical protein